MNKPVIHQNTLEDMAKYFLKTIFHNIPYIPVSYSNEIDGSLGIFNLEKPSDYDPDNDELLHAYEYRWNYVNLWDDLGGVDIGKESSWSDPLNHPDISILISGKCEYGSRCIVATLLHELAHYYCWYVGLDYHDESRDFLDICKNLDLPDNFNNWKWDGNSWRDIYDYTKIDRYIEMYICGTMEKAA